MTAEEADSPPADERCAICHYFDAGKITGSGFSDCLHPKQPYMRTHHSASCSEWEPTR